jgi:beta-alanine degradation protein BauB
MQRKLCCFVCFVVLVGVAGIRALAQDPIEAGAGMYRLLFENEQVRVMEVTFQPGQSIKPHSHPDHFVYVLSGGSLRLFKPDGTSTDITIEPEQVIWIPSETHWAENIADTVVKLLVTELKAKQ